MSNAIGRVVIGVGPHKLSATIEVVDQQEKKLGNGRFTTDQAGNKAMRAYASTWPDRIWAVEGANGAGRPLAQRLLEAGENVVDIPAKLAARVRLFDTGHNRKTDALDAHSVARTRIKHTTITNKSDTSKCLRAAPARCLNCSTRRAKTRCLFTLPGPLSLAHSPWPTLRSRERVSRRASDFSLPRVWTRNTEGRNHQRLCGVDGSRPADGRQVRWSKGGVTAQSARMRSTSRGLSSCQPWIN
jgi:hypothetical protein